MQPAVPQSPEAAWDEAFLRVESYLRAHQLESRMQLSQLTAEIIAAARVQAAEQPDEPPVTVAMRIAHLRIGDWVVRAMDEGAWPDERFRARGRLALLMAEVPQSAPKLFLSDQPIPEDLVQRLAEAKLQAGPELRMTNMPPAPLDAPEAPAEQEKWVTFSRSVFLHASGSWLVIAFVLGAAWFATR